jgi:nitroimidazol reductase NimA-like FMN-containing flavoprotein (pyridoxamine 5'-phosphate oxidase superfamily)
MVGSASEPKEDPRTKVRRADRQIEAPEEIQALLESGRVAFIATSVDGQPYIHNNLYWYDSDSNRIYFHTARTGRTRSNIETNPSVCFSIGEMGRLLPADIALEFSVEYSSVMVFGGARVVEDDVEAEHGLQGLLDKYFPDLEPGKDYRAITAEEIKRTSVFAIEIESWSGKKKTA